MKRRQPGIPECAIDLEPLAPPLVVFRAVEEISRADGSIGWCTMIATAGSNSISWLEPEVRRQMAGAPADMRLAARVDIDVVVRSAAKIDRGRALVRLVLQKVECVGIRRGAAE